MASNSSVAFKHWTRIIARWPRDHVRPENVSFQTIMKRRIDKHIGNTPNATKPKSKDAAIPAVEHVLWDEPKEMHQTNVLYSLLENRYVQKHPVPETLRKPASNPTYYDDLVKEMQEAPNRTWIGGVVKRIKGSFRLT